MLDSIFGMILYQKDRLSHYTRKSSAYSNTAFYVIYVGIEYIIMGNMFRINIYYMKQHEHTSG